MLKFIFAFSFFAQALLPLKQIPAITKTFKDVSGKNIEIQTGSEGTLVIFTSEHCPYDLKLRSYLSGLVEQAAKGKIKSYFVNSNDPKILEQNNLKTMSKSWQVLKIEAPYLLDSNGDLAKAFRVERTPTAYLFNGKGHLEYFGKVTRLSQNSVDTTSLAKALQSLSEGKALSSHETSVIGCKIERKN